MNASNVSKGSLVNDRRLNATFLFVSTHKRTVPLAKAATRITMRPLFCNSARDTNCFHTDRRSRKRKSRYCSKTFYCGILKLMKPKSKTMTHTRIMCQPLEKMAQTLSTRDHLTSPYKQLPWTSLCAHFNDHRTCPYNRFVQRVDIFRTACENAVKNTTCTRTYTQNT